MNSNLLVIYLIELFFHRLKEFLRHWYVKSFRIYSNRVVSFLEQLDRFFALKITLRHLFHPLYQDYSLIGYILGFIFRIIRVVGAVVFYGIVIVMAVLVYLFWLIIPVFLIYKILL